MQSYQDALGQFKQEQNEEAYERFLAREETAKAEKEAYDAEQQGLFSTIDAMVDEGYITDKESAIAKMKAYGADDATVQKFSDYWDSTRSKGNTTGTVGGSTGEAADKTVEISGDAVGGEDATGNLATFKYSEENGYSGSLTATSKNSDDPLRVDPQFKRFDFSRDGDEGEVTYDGTTYTIAVSDLQPQSFLSTAKAILGDNYNKPQAMFMYNGEIYMVSDKKYSDGNYKIYLMKGTGDLKDAITDSFK
jgi:hypothetical protein